MWNSTLTYPFDVFNGKGERIEQVVLPRGRRLVAFGKSSLYLVRVDSDGLQELERYRLPD